MTSKTLEDDLFPYVLGDEENMQEWNEFIKGIFVKVKDNFYIKDISAPKVVIDSTAAPITYGITTTGTEGNITNILTPE